MIYGTPLGQEDAAIERFKAEAGLGYLGADDPIEEAFKREAGLAQAEADAAVERFKQEAGLGAGTTIIELEDGTLGYVDSLGFFNPIKAAKKGWKKAKSAARRAKRIAKAAVKKAAKIAKAAFNFQMRIAIRLAKAVCRIPKPARIAAATAAGVNPNLVPVFCKAVRLKRKSQIRRLLPPMIKLGVKAAAVGAIPALGPILRMAKFVPGLRQFADATDPEALEAADQIQLLDAMSEDEIALGVAEVDDDFIADALGADAKRNWAVAGVVAGGITLATIGLYAHMRRYEY